jgi:hypothetical protein
MNVADLANWAQIITAGGMFVSAGMLILAWRFGTQFVTKSAFEKYEAETREATAKSRQQVSDQLNALSNSVAVLSEKLSSLPSHSEFHRLEVLLTRVDGAVDTQREIAKRIEESVRTHSSILAETARLIGDS